MKKRFLLVFTTLIYSQILFAQILYNETFDNLTLGNITNDPSGVMPGQGNWYVKLQGPTIAKIAVEPAKGKVLAIENSSNFQGRQKNLQTVWNNRTTGNNILLAEYDFYSEDIENASRFYLIASDNTILIDMILQTKYNSTLKVKEAILDANFPAQGGTSVFTQKGFNYIKSWLTVKIYIDYNTYKLYIHIPKLNILYTVLIKQVLPVDQIYFLSSLHNTFSGIHNKFDNFRLTALKNVPPEVLSSNSFLSEKFTLFPNPITDIVNITNSGNMFVNQVEIYDVSGKSIIKQTFNNESETQLDTTALPSGTYLLHLQTNEGIAVKKLIKK